MAFLTSGILDVTPVELHSYTEMHAFLSGSPESSFVQKLVVQQRVVMPIDAFLRAAVRMQSSVQDMVKKGVIQRSPKSIAAKEPAESQKK